MATEAITRVRAFNRTVAASIGLLDDRFLGRGRPLAQSRLLWEIGRDGIGIRELRQRLGLDSGYASRMLRALEGEGLVENVPDPADRRRRLVRLTPRGEREWNELDARSDALASGLLDGLTSDDAAELVRAMTSVERLLVRARTTIAPADPDDADVGRAFARYREELDRRFEAGFDPSRSIRVDPDELRPPRGVVLLMRVGSEPAGCGLLRFHDDGSAELKRMWLSPRYRGRGLGADMLGALEAEASDRGARRVRLETNRALVEAIAMYRRAGYEEVPAFNDEPYAHHWFEKELTGAER